MKKKTAVMFLIMAMTMGTLAACGQKVEEVVNTVESTDEVEVESMVGTETEEETAGAEEAESTEEDEGNPIESIDEEILAENEEIEESTEEEGNGVETDGYTFTEMDETIMYAKSAVNVRNLPGTDGERVGGLSAADEVTVTARCNETGWYQIGEGMYVSDNYLADEMPVQQASPGNTAQSSGTSESDGLPAQVDNSSFPANGSVEDWNSAVTDEELMAIMMAMLDELANGGSSAGTTITGTVPASSPWASAQLLTDILGLVNSARADAGLESLTWDSGLDSLSMQRAVEITTDFSHNGVPGGCGENIAMNSASGTAQTFFNQWMNSQPHKENILGGAYASISVAAYYDGSAYYAVMLLR